MALFYRCRSEAGADRAPAHDWISSYTALSRARDATQIFLIDTPTEHQLDRAEIAPDHPRELVDERTPLERLEAAMRRRDDATTRISPSTA